MTISNHNLTIAVRRLAALALLFLPALARSITLLETTAWLRADHVGGQTNKLAALDVDSLGNVFAWSAAANAGQTAIELEKITQAGAQSSATAGTFTEATANLVKVAPDNSVYVAGTYYHDVNTPGQLYVARYSNSLQKMWEVKFFNQLDSTETPVGIEVDSQENVQIVFAIQAGAPFGPALEIDQLNSLGKNDTLIQFDSNMSPSNAQFFGGRWYVVGADTTATAPGGARWAVYSDQPEPSQLFGGTKANGNYTNDTDVYNFVLGPSSDMLLVVTQLTHEFTKDSTDFNRYYTTQRYNSAGSPVGTFVGAYQGEITAISNGGANGPVYECGYFDGTTQTLGTAVVYQNNNDVQLNYVWQNTSFVQTLLPNSTGLFGVGTDNAGQKAWSYYFDKTTGDTLWSTNFEGTVGGVTTPSAALNSKNALFVGTTVIDGSLNPSEVRQYVPGINLSYVQTSATTVHNAGTVTITVGLNSPAPTGGYVVNLSTSSAKLLFGSSQTKSVTVPAGHLTATATATGGSVTANTSVVVTALQNGIVRTVNVTVEH